MSVIGPLSSAASMPLPGTAGMPPMRGPGELAPGRSPGVAPAKDLGGSDFGELLGKAVDTVRTQQAEAQAATRAVLTGESDQIHQSMIAMQESSVAFSLMVEVRNRLVESYQELMRMPV